MSGVGTDELDWLSSLSHPNPPDLSAVGKSGAITVATGWRANRTATRRWSAQFRCLSHLSINCGRVASLRYTRVNDGSAALLHVTRAGLRVGSFQPWLAESGPEIRELFPLLHVTPSVNRLPGWRHTQADCAGPTYCEAVLQQRHLEGTEGLGRSPIDPHSPLLCSCRLWRKRNCRS